MIKLLSALVLVLGCSAASLNVLPVELEKKESQENSVLENSNSNYSFAFDVSVPTSAYQMPCLKNEGNKAVFVRVYNPAGNGYFDTNSINTIQNAHSAGLGIEVYMTPQPKSNKRGSQQLDEAYRGLTSKGIQVGTIWIQVVVPENWLTPQNNIDFIQSMMTRAKQYNLDVGIYTSDYDWYHITNQWNLNGREAQLWFYLVFGGGRRGESSPNFNGFQPFAGWTYPSVKQFGQSETECGLVMNRNAFLSSSIGVAHDSEVPVAGFLKL